MDNAKKLSYQLPILDLDNFELIPDKGEFRHVIFENNAGVTRFKLPDTISKNILSCFPAQFVPYVFCINLSYIQSALPHFHTYDESVVNYYIDTDEYETIFYRSTVDPIDTKTDLNSANEGLIKFVNINTIEPIEKFVAKTGDCYVLNSKAIHSVSQINDTRTSLEKFRPIKKEHRIAYQIWTKCPFDLAISLLS